MNGWSFLGSLVAAALIWGYYRRRVCPSSERYSTFGPRFWTGMVDGWVLWPVGFICESLLLRNIPRGLAALILIFQSLAWLVYTVVMHARYGQTVGKMVTKVRVVDYRTEGPISWFQAWLREGLPMLLSLSSLGYEVFAVLTGRIAPSAVASGDLANTRAYQLCTILPACWFFAEALTMLTNEKRRALHDFIAGTVVVRTNTEEGSASAEPVSAPLPTAGAPLQN